METRNITIVCLSTLLVVSIISQLFSLGLKINRVQSDINNQNRHIENLQESLNKIIERMQTSDGVG